jgi:hypothetical protein
VTHEVNKYMLVSLLTTLLSHCGDDNFFVATCSCDTTGVIARFDHFTFAITTKDATLHP